MKNDRSQSYEACPMLARNNQINQLSSDMAEALRGLRRDMRYCDYCKLKPHECRLLIDLNHVVSAAIDEITREWNLVHSNRRETS